ncbi:sensor histidine kinase [Polyangium jinanense]|uniref:Histidine kinase n=1 Tax=Polyangium jinanense TaxID=2829994 RepID=A0A9X4AVC5_9BACT|nr:histidine kinase [Polyangium jinanense]MDC3959539.1 histidine kinase [Polyangium jinanense]MDC3986138.1 histidine kinase [Polyangium jinanense]
MTARAAGRPEPLEEPLAIATLRALAAPRRLVPILVMTVTLLVAQARSGGSASLAVGVALCASFTLLAPVSWRAIAADRPTLLRVLAYAALGAIVVFGIGGVIPRWLRLGPSFLTVPANLVSSLALYWVGGWGLGRDIDLEVRLVAQRERAERLEREAERAQLLALRAHLDPHFLFNTLNAIAEWCRVDGAVAEEAVLRLASMLRAILAGVRAEWWPLEQELALVRTLFELFRLRDPTRFTVVMELDPDAAPLPVPPLVLLLLAENAMKHGPGAGHEGEVRLVIRRVPGALRITLSNPGAYAGPRAGSDGLPTVQRRLALAYDERARLSIRGEDDRTRVDLELPEVTS